jgi:hypothetical protein
MLGDRVIRRVAIWIAFTALVAVAAAEAATSGAGTDNTRINGPSTRWHAADDCNREAFKKYPDYTQEGAAKRDAYLRQCLRDHHLPPPGNPVQTKPQGQ